VQFNGKNVSPAFYCQIPNKNWLSFKDNLVAGDEVIVEYEYSTDGDMVVTNWDSGKGNYIFYNNPQSTDIEKQEENENADYINLFPNPVDETLTVTFHSESSQRANIFLTDLSGKSNFYEKSNWIEKGINIITLHTGTLKSGIYQLRIKTATKSEVRKVVKR
jgi:hypothetical protein